MVLYSFHHEHIWRESRRNHKAREPLHVRKPEYIGGRRTVSQSPCFATFITSASTVQAV